MVERTLSHAGGPRRWVVPRRPPGRLLASFTLVLGCVLVLGPASVAVGGARADNPIVVENQHPGSDQWRVTRGADDIKKQIEGYAGATSTNKGGSITFFVTVNPVQTYTIDVFRMGWYQGKGGRLLQHVGPLDGVRQPPCPRDASTGLIDCNWSPSHTLSVPTTWTSGIYLALLTNAQGYQSYINFVVRDDARTGGLLYQESVATYQAYNNWPNDFATGKSLYPYDSFGPNTASGEKRAVKVSFNRPYADKKNWGAGDFLNWEVYFVRWLERSGYDISYSTDVDTHTDGQRLLRHSGFLSVGHDEYWSRAMYDAAERARGSGVSLAFFGANPVYWQIRFEPSPATGAANRVIVCYKSSTLDPVKGATTTDLWRSRVVNRPEQRLVGVQFVSALADTTQPLVPYVVRNSLNWVYGGTGFHDGDTVPGLVGYEMDAVTQQLPAPRSRGPQLHAPVAVTIYELRRHFDLGELVDLPGAKRRLGFWGGNHRLELGPRQRGRR